MKKLSNQLWDSMATRWVMIRVKILAFQNHRPPNILVNSFNAELSCVSKDLKISNSTKNSSEWPKILNWLKTKRSFKKIVNLSCIVRTQSKLWSNCVKAFKRWGVKWAKLICILRTVIKLRLKLYYAVVWGFTMINRLLYPKIDHKWTSKHHLITL